MNSITLSTEQWDKIDEARRQLKLRSTISIETVDNVEGMIYVHVGNSNRHHMLIARDGATLQTEAKR